jgi:hypothetical protein
VVISKENPAEAAEAAFDPHQMFGEVEMRGIHILEEVNPAA